MPHVDLEEVFEDDGWGEIPEQTVDTLKAIPLWVPDDMQAEEAEVYDRALKGHCMTCGGPLGLTTMVTVNQAGIVMLHCGGACYTDQQVLGWLQEHYDDMVERLKFRGGQESDGPEGS